MTASTYYSFLLRLWQVKDDGQDVWRASLQSILDGEQHGFSSPEALVAYLGDLTNETISVSQKGDREAESPACLPPVKDPGAQDPGKKGEKAI